MNKTLSWKPGRMGGAVVSEAPCADAHKIDSVTGHADVPYYGGYLVAESVPPELVPLITAAPDLLKACEAWQKVSDHLTICDSCTDAYCNEGTTLWNAAIEKNEAAICKARAKTEDAPSA